MTHYASLVVAYAVALGSWLLVLRAFPSLWPRKDGETFAHPWRETGFALIAVIFVLGVGQLYSAGLLLPARGRIRPLTDAVNQALIFSPMFLLLIVRRQPLETAWLPRDRIWARLLCGLILAQFAVAVYLAVREGNQTWTHVVRQVYDVKRLPMLVQVFCEDAGIAVVFVRLRAAVGTRWAIGLVSALFAAGHIPAMIAGGAELSGMGHLLIDAALAIAVLSVLRRASDVWWFWSVHYAMDMMQFAGVLESR